MKKALIFLLSVCAAAGIMASEKALISISVTAGTEVSSLSLEQLAKLNSYSCKVFDPWLGYKEYRGVTLKELLNFIKASPDIKSVKIYDKNGGAVNINPGDIDKYPIMLAFEERNVSLPPCQGGPVKLVFPINSNPELSAVYPRENWLWYVVKIELVK